MRASISFRNSELQAADVLDNGFVRFYDGTQPVDPDTPLSGNTLIVQCALGNPACASASGATRAFNPITAGIVAATGTPTFARFFRSDGTTAVADMKVPDEIILSKEDWESAEPFAGPSVTWSIPVGP